MSIGSVWSAIAGFLGLRIDPAEKELRAKIHIFEKTKQDEVVDGYISIVGERKRIQGFLQYLQNHGIHVSASDAMIGVAAIVGRLEDGSQIVNFDILFEKTPVSLIGQVLRDQDENMVTYDRAVPRIVYIRSCSFEDLAQSHT